LVDVLKNPEQVLQNRFGRRGFSLEECKKILGNKKGDVIHVKQWSFRGSDLRDAATPINC